MASLSQHKFAYFLVQTHVLLGLNVLVPQTLLLVCALQIPLRYDANQPPGLYITPTPESIVLAHSDPT